MLSEYGIVSSSHKRDVFPTEEGSGLSGNTLISKIKEIYKRYENNGVVVYGNHHQAILLSKLPKNLETLLVWPPNKIKIPYLTVDKNYDFAVLTQFHPEVKDDVGETSEKLSQFNKDLLSLFYDYVTQYHLSQKERSLKYTSSDSFSYYVVSPWLEKAVERELSARSWIRKGTGSKSCVDPKRANPNHLPPCCDAQQTANCVLRDFFPVDYVQTDGKFRHDRGLYQNFHNPKLINRFRDKRALADKDLLFKNLKNKKSFKPFELSQWAFERSQSADLGRVLSEAYKEAEYLILKPTNGFGGKGIGIVKVEGAKTTDGIRDHINKFQDYTSWVAQVYIGNPMLFKGKKFHFRIYLLVSKFFGKISMYTSPQTWIYSALKEFGAPEEALKHLDDKQRHVSSMAAGQTEHLFPKEILHDTYHELSGDVVAEYINEQFKVLLWESASDIVSKFECPKGIPQCYDIFGADVMMDHNFHPKLLEFNGGVGYGDKTADTRDSDCWESQFVGAYLRKTVDAVFDTGRDPIRLESNECPSFDLEPLNIQTVQQANEYIANFKERHDWSANDINK